MENWIECSSGLPDSDETVMVFAAVGNEPVWPGYHDGENWFDASGVKFVAGAVTHWMSFPDPPVSL